MVLPAYFLETKSREEHEADRSPIYWQIGGKQQGLDSD